MKIQTRLLTHLILFVLVFQGGHVFASRKKAVINEINNTIILSDDYTVNAWDVPSGRLLWNLDQTEKVEHVIADPSGKYVLTAFRGGTISLWDMKTGNLLRTLGSEIGRKRIKWIKIDLSGKYIIIMYKGIYIYSTSRDHITSIWDAETGRIIKSLRGLSNVEIAPLGKYAACSKGSRKMEVIKKNANMLAVVRKDKGTDFQDLFGDDLCNEIMIRDLATGELAGTLEGHPEEIKKIVIDATGSYILGTSRSGDATIWDKESGAIVKSFKLDNDPVDKDRVKTDLGGRFIIYQRMNSRKINVWDFHTGKKVLQIEEHAPKMPKMIGIVRTYAISKISDGIKIWDMSAGNLVAEVKSPYSYVEAIDPLGRFAVTASRNFISVWNLPSGQEQTDLVGHRKEVYFLKVLDKTPLSKNSVLISRCYNGVVNIWDMVTGRLLRTAVFPGKIDSRLPPTFIINNRYIAGKDGSGSFIVWDSADNETYILGSHETEGAGAAVHTSVKPEKNMEALIKDLKHKSGRVRVHSRKAITKHGTDRDAQRLVTLLLEEKNPGQQMLTAQVIGKIAGENTVSLLIQKLSDTDPHVRSSALLALAETGNSEAIEHIQSLLKDRSKDIQNLAVRYLRKAYSGQPSEFYGYLLKYGNHVMQDDAICRLENVRDDRALQLLAEAAQWIRPNLQAPEFLRCSFHLQSRP